MMGKFNSFQKCFETVAEVSRNVPRVRRIRGNIALKCEAGQEAGSTKDKECQVHIGSKDQPCLPLLGILVTQWQEAPDVLSVIIGSWIRWMHGTEGSIAVK